MSSASGGSEASSHSSFSGTGTGGSVISNSNSDAGALAKLSDRDQDASIQDLLQQNKGLWDAAFSCLLLLTKNRAVRGYRMLAFRVVFEYLQIFRLVFNTRFLWVIRTDVWIWKAFYWVLFRFLVWDMGYDKYVLGLYVVCGVVLALTLMTIVIAVVLRKDDSTNKWLARIIWTLQNGALLVFSICWVSVLDYLVFMFTCKWGHGNTHLHWKSVQCVTMPHLASMAFAGATAIVTIVVVACLAMAECSGNLVSDNLMSSPVAETAFKTTALKVIMVCLSTCLDEFPQPQAILMFICPCLSAYLQIRSSPYLLPWMNHLWTGLWSALVYTTAILLTLNYYQPPEPFSLEVPGTELPFRESMTWAVLYGIFPAVLLGAGISWLVQRWKSKPIALFEKAREEAAEGRMHLESIAVLKGIYKFHSPDQVAFLARSVRRFDAVTDIVLPEAAALCNLIIQAGLARFPNDPTILLVYANYIIHVKKEPRAARQQLQLASKGEPSIIERYNIFAANDVLKRNRSDADAGLDLMAYVEFQRNYRACIKAHKMALLAQRAFWRSLMRDGLRLDDMLASLKAMEAAEQISVYVYKRVLERYPQNGKVLKVWGRFQEWVLHDPSRAARSYAEAIKRGLGDNMLNLTSDDTEGGGAEVMPTKVDEKLDGVVIIDAGGSILMVNKVALRMFGYARGELDGKNINVLMPQPFSSRHDSYLSNYLTTGVAKVLGQSRDVVALTKDRVIFPLSLFVSRLSGTGQESVFMGVLRVAEEEDTNIVRVWCTPNGVILCCDRKLGDWFGVSVTEFTGRPVSTLGHQPEAIDSFVKDAFGASKLAAAQGRHRMQTSLMHKYLQAMEVEVQAGFGGTDNEPVLMLRIRSLNETQRLMVVDDRMRVVYATDTLAKMLSASVSALTEMSLPNLIVPPAAQLHKRWVATMAGERPPQGSCRSGAVVCMLAANGARIPVRLEIKTVEHANQDHVQSLHIVKVNRATTEEQLDSQRVSLTVDQRGVVLAASASPKSLFGFDPSADLVGQPLAAFINMFEDFRAQQQQLLARQPGGGGVGSSNNRGSNPASAGSGGGTSRGVQQSYSQLALQIAPAQDPSSGAAGAAGAAESDDSMLLTLLAQAAQEGSEASYRVGVRPCPLASHLIGKGADQQQMDAAAGVSTLLAALGGRGSSRMRSAVMKVDVVETDWTQESADSHGVQFQVQLWNVEHMCGALELDAKLKVVKSDPAVGQMLGLAASDLNRKLLSKLLVLPGHIKEASDLLLAQGQKQHKASALKKKSHAGKEAAVGPVLEVEARHADGQPVKLQVQAVAKEGQASRLLLRIKLALPASSGSLPSLLQLCGASSILGGGGSNPTGKPLAAAAGSAAAAAGAASVKVRQGADGDGPKSKAGLRAGGGSDASHTDSEGEAAAAAGAGLSRGKPAGGRSYKDPAAAGGASAGRGLRFAAAGAEEDEEEEEEREGARGRGRASGRFAAGKGVPPAVATDSEPDREGHGWGAEDYPDGGQYSSSAKWHQLRSPVHSGAGGKLAAVQQQEEEEEEDDGGMYKSGPPIGRAVGRAVGRSSLGLGRGGTGMEEDSEMMMLAAAGGGGDGYDEGGGELDEPGVSRAGHHGGAKGPGGDDGASDAGSDEEGSKLDIGSASEAGDGDFGEDVTCDWRRAKRLRRILRQLDSPIARAPLLRFWRGTWGVVAVLMVAHIVCYAVLATIVAQKQTDVYGVQQLANAVDKSQMILLRANFLSKCNYAEHASYEVCSPAQKALYISKSISNVQQMRRLHEGVFLGTDASKVVRLSDVELLSWWMLPKQTEHVFFDTNPPSSSLKDVSLWNLGNRFIAAATEVNYASKVLQLDGETLETTRFWKYVLANGKETLFKAYAVSLDLYVLFCWDQLGGLSNLLTGLLVAELVAVALLAMAFQLDLVRRVCKQRMSCFSVFLALPSATLRTMATAPCQVDEDDDDGSDAEEELELMGGGDDPGAGMATTGAASANKTNKSVRLAVEEATAGDTGDGKPSSKPGKLLAKHKGKKQQELTGVLGWVVKKYKAVRHVARGTFNRVMRVNGKKLHPARGAFASFMLPLLCWWLVAMVIYGVSFQKVAMLQAPLLSMQAAAHVQFFIARTRMLANLIGFLPDMVTTPERTELVSSLQDELEALRSEYFAMLYGGRLKVALNTTTPVASSASLFRDGHIADLFFRTTSCLRADQSTCWGPTSQWYDITHNGIDAMIQRFMVEVNTFAVLPPANQTVLHPSYEFTWRVGANDLYEGLATVSDVFVGTTLNALSSLQQLHTYLLIASMAIFVGVVVVMLLPFKRRLVTESVKLAGLLSQLPQESDVEGQVKLLVLDAASGHKPSEAAGGKSWSLARSVTGAAAAAARAAASRAAGAMGNIKTRMAEANAANAAAAAANWGQYQGGNGWQQQQQQYGGGENASEDDASSAPEWE